MELPSTKTCENCKREIPEVNFTTHSLHCVRNIRLCHVCHQPVPSADLAEHCERLHRQVPCHQCSESVRGSDLEDHIRDSCALTCAACRYCDLELPRREMPAHEVYCGSRTNRCECGELVMLKYRQLHEQTQHTFVKLDDEPGPEPSWKKYEAKSKQKSAKANSRPSANQEISPTANAQISEHSANQRPSTSSLTSSEPTMLRMPSSNEPISSEDVNTDAAIGQQNHGRTSKRTNDMPQLNTTVQETSKVEKKLASVNQRPQSKKKRPAPPRPDAPLTIVTHGNFGTQVTQTPRASGDQSGPQQLSSVATERIARVPARGEGDAGNARDRFGLIKQELRELRRGLNEVTAPYNTQTQRPQPTAATSHQSPVSSPQSPVVSSPSPPIPTTRPVCRSSHTHRPPSPMGQPGYIWMEHRQPDIFVRRESGNWNLGRVDNLPGYVEGEYDMARNLGRVTITEVVEEAPAQERLPCEFCGELIWAEDLVQHQTGCRPDLARLPRRSASPTDPRAYNDNYHHPPTIPCEFCGEPLPLHQLMGHQNRCQHRRVM